MLFVVGVTDIVELVCELDERAIEVVEAESAVEDSEAIVEAAEDESKADDDCITTLWDLDATMEELGR